MPKELDSRLKKDCLQKGRGRKAWWARQLGVAPLMLSHWLSERQRPNGRYAVAIREILDGLEQTKKSALWEDAMWNCYFTGQKIPDKILPLVVCEILSSPRLKTRTVALLAKILRSHNTSFEKPASESLQNRLGWLLDIAGLEVPFSPGRSAKTQSPFSLPSDRRYLHRHQTPAGQKWKIRDCSLDQILESLP